MHGLAHLHVMHNWGADLAGPCVQSSRRSSLQSRAAQGHLPKPSALSTSTFCVARKMKTIIALTHCHVCNVRPQVIRQSTCKALAVELQSVPHFAIERTQSDGESAVQLGYRRSYMHERRDTKVETPNWKT